MLYGQRNKYYGDYMMKTKLISFYSDIADNTYYSEHYERLKLNCERLNIPYDFREKESLGSYQLNCLSKPQFILDVLGELDAPIVWVDIDTVIHYPLDMFDTFGQFDIVAASSNHTISGTKASPLYFNNTEESKYFLRCWIENTKKVIDEKEAFFDHEVLFPLLGEFSTKESRIKIAYLPPEFCVWPGNTNKDSIITMGLADNNSKKESLKNMGMSDNIIEWQCTGNRHLNDDGNIKI